MMIVWLPLGRSASFRVAQSRPHLGTPWGKCFHQLPWRMAPSPLPCVFHFSNPEPVLSPSEGLH